MSIRLFVLHLSLALVTSLVASEARGDCEELMPLIEEVASEHDLDPALMAAIIAVESRFKTVTNKRSGARGLMQVMPKTARRLGCGSLDSPRSNLTCGAILLQRLLKRYDGSILLTLSGYHAGLKMPNDAQQNARFPANRSYLEKVLATRTRLLREGCP